MRSVYRLARKRLRGSLLLHDGVGIGALCLTGVLLLGAYLVRDEVLAYVLVVLTFAPGYLGVRWLVRRDR
jgi:hypothetical protein